MVKKSGLGRGLGALIKETEDKKVGLQEIDLNLISPRKDQPRKVFDKDALDQLASSIKEHGVLQPIVVRKVGEGYELIAGERRFRASKEAGLNRIPAIIKEADDSLVRELSIIENIQREDLNPVEEAMAYKSFMEEFNLTQAQVAEKLGKSRSYVANITRLLKLDEETKKYLVDGEITSSQARTLLSIEDEKKRKAQLEKLLSKAANVRDLEKVARAKSPKKEDIFVKDLEERLTEIFATQVRLNKSKKGGKIEIKYYSLDDLDRILEIIEK